MSLFLLPVDKPCTLKANVAFLRTSTIIDVGLGVSLKDVYVMGSYYQGKVNLYERPEGYPTFKVVGTATAEDGFIPLTILKNYGFEVQGDATSISWDLDSQIKLLWMFKQGKCVFHQKNIMICITPYH